MKLTSLLCPGVFSFHLSRAFYVTARALLSARVFRGLGRGSNGLEKVLARGISRLYGISHGEYLSRERELGVGDGNFGIFRGPGSRGLERVLGRGAIRVLAGSNLYL